MKLSLSTASLSTYIKEGMSDFDALKTIRCGGFRLVDYCLTPHNTDNCLRDGRLLLCKDDPTQFHQFQSTPLREGRRSSTNHVGGNEYFIHAPARGATRAPARVIMHNRAASSAREAM